LLRSISHGGWPDLGGTMTLPDHGCGNEAAAKMAGPSTDKFEFARTSPPEMPKGSARELQFNNELDSIAPPSCSRDGDSGASRRTTSCSDDSRTKRADPKAAGDDRGVGEASRSRGEGPAESAAIAGQSAGDRHAAADDAGDAVDQAAAVDHHAGSENENGLEAGRGDLASDALAGGERIFHAGQPGAALGQDGMVEMYGGDAATAVIDAVRVDFPCRRAAKQDGLRQGLLQQVGEAGGAQVVDRAEDQGEACVGALQLGQPVRHFTCPTGDDLFGTHVLLLRFINVKK